MHLHFTVIVCTCEKRCNLKCVCATATASQRLISLAETAAILLPDNDSNSSFQPLPIVCEQPLFATA